MFLVDLRDDTTDDDNYGFVKFLHKLAILLCSLFVNLGLVIIMILCV